MHGPILLASAVIAYTVQQLDQVRPARDIAYLTGALDDDPVRHVRTLPQRMSRVLSDGPAPNDSAVSSMFRIADFQCNATAAEDICAKVRTAYVGATTRLSMILDLQRPIDLQVVWKDMCPNEAECIRSTLGQASPSAFWAVDNLVVPEGAPKLDANYMYPQAVVKQYTSDLNFLPFDIVIGNRSPAHLTSRTRLQAAQPHVVQGNPTHRPL